MTRAKEPTDETKALLKQIVEHFEDEDRSVRDRQVRQWRRMKLLWENVQHVYYSEIAHDWRVPTNEGADGESDQGFYDKPVNVFRAYLESIIAALSVTVPPVTCYPDDADDPLDVATAKAGDKIAALIFRHNDAPLFWLHALFIFCTEGMTACYTYAKESDDYGIYREKQYQEFDETHQLTNCPYCQAEMSDKVVNPNSPPPVQEGLTPISNPNGSFSQNQSIDDSVNESPDEFAPEGPSDQINQMEQCPECGRTVLPQQTEKTFTVTRMVGVTENPKSRVCMEVYGGLFVKVPIWARNQADCSYLIHAYETHYANAIEEFPDARETIHGGTLDHNIYEQWARTSPQYRGEQPIHNVTVRKCWLRCASFNILNEDESNHLRKLYPDGVKVCVINDTVVSAENQSLDDYWTLTQNPLSDYIHFDPLGLLLTSVQDITNDLISLVLQTVEHGIPQTFADPKVLNFNAYRNSEVIPGGIYPASPKSGKPLSDGFYEVRTATLSQEVLPFAQKIQEIGQLVSGALPSLFGGQMSGSRTASEYSMSRAQALQRLQTTWKMLLHWWKNVFGKAIPMYIKEMKEDEKQVSKDNFGNFVNTFIRMSELQGKIGEIELEANENLPITWNQQKDAIMELFKLNNDGITQTLGSPENLPYIKQAIGLTDYVIPGEDDRQKEYEEIQLLINSEPIEQPVDPMMAQQAMQMGMPPPQPTQVPSIEPDFDIDNHKLAADIDRRWLVSDAGRLCKLENPTGYQNVLLHMKIHTQMDQQKSAPPISPGVGPAGPDAASTGMPMQQGQNQPTVQ